MDVLDPLLPARRSGAVVISEGATSTEAFRAIADECASHWRANEAAVIESRAMVHLHQMRVGIRRLRSSFSLLRPLWATASGADETAHELRSLAAGFGVARDLDVLLTGDLARTLSEHQRELLWSGREAAYDHVIETVTGAPWRAVSERLDEIIAGPLWSGYSDPSARVVAGAALEKRYRRVVKRGRKLRRISDSARHEIRIEAKKLRYGCEFFDSLYAAERPLVETAAGELSAPRAFGREIEQLQTVLGELNDHAAAAAYLAPVGAPPPPLDRDDLLNRMEQVYGRIAALEPFWR